jgi:hypothetical protein
MNGMPSDSELEDIAEDAYTGGGTILDGSMLRATTAVRDAVAKVYEAEIEKLKHQIEVEKDRGDDLRAELDRLTEQNDRFECMVYVAGESGVTWNFEATGECKCIIASKKPAPTVTPEWLAETFSNAQHGVNPYRWYSWLDVGEDTRRNSIDAAASVLEHWPKAAPVTPNPDPAPAPTPLPTRGEWMEAIVDLGCSDIASRHISAITEVIMEKLRGVNASRTYTEAEAEALAKVIVENYYSRFRWENTSFRDDWLKAARAAIAHLGGRVEG